MSKRTIPVVLTDNNEYSNEQFYDVRLYLWRKKRTFCELGSERKRSRQSVRRHIVEGWTACIIEDRVGNQRGLALQYYSRRSRLPNLLTVQTLLIFKPVYQSQLHCLISQNKCRFVFPRILKSPWPSGWIFFMCMCFEPPHVIVFNNGWMSNLRGRKSETARALN